jgi:hypothetical protein
MEVRGVVNSIGLKQNNYTRTAKCKTSMKTEMPKTPHTWYSGKIFFSYSIIPNELDTAAYELFHLLVFFSFARAFAQSLQ